MAKKRKASGQAQAQAKRGKSDKEDSRLAIRSFEDVADSEDEFHVARDKVLLDEEPDAKRQRKWREADEFLEDSEEEVFAPTGGVDADDDEEDTDEDDSEEEQAQDTGDEEGGEEGWGPSKRDYYDADAIENEQDALEEEAEALRIQKKQLAKLSDADFGFDEALWAQGEQDTQADEDEGPIVEKLPQLQINPEMPPTERLQLLKQTYPEFEPLAQEFLTLGAIHDELASTARTADLISKQANSAVITKYRAIAAYMACLSMYFAILTSTATNASLANAKPANEMRNHPVMEELVKCKELWEKVKDIKTSDQVLNVDNQQEVEEPALEEKLLSEEIKQDSSKSGLSKTQKRKQSKAARAALAAEAEAAAKRAERMRMVDEDLADLSQLAKKSVSVKRQSKVNTPFILKADADNEDLGEETPLTAAEAAEKAARKKSLRFYTSQIVQKANKRDRAGRGAGGDDDIPHRERLRDRQARLNAEAERRGKNQKADELGGESDDEDRRVAKDVRGEDNEDDYYDQIISSNKTKKAQKAALAAAHAAASASDRIIPVEEVGPDGRREITYAIAKNKGLTQHRKKESRNPRVKKRLRYEEKKKKLASVRAVYKGGEGRGGYGGELTGIKKGLVKSVKL